LELEVELLDEAENLGKSWSLASEAIVRLV
jgi:hypothetical protein